MLKFHIVKTSHSSLSEIDNKISCAQYVFFLIIRNSFKIILFLLGHHLITLIKKTVNKRVF